MFKVQRSLSERVVGLKDEVVLNPHAGTWSWLLHRITGVALTFYLFMHFWVLSSAAQGKETFNQRLAQVQTPLFKILEILLVAVVAFHLFNGLRIILVEFTLFTRAQRKLLWAAMAAFALTMAYTAYVFFVRIIAPA